MSSPRVTYHARVKRQRRRLPLKALPFLMLLLIKVSLFIVPLAFCGLYMLEHGTPHILWEYEYYGSADDPQYVSCTYWGVYGQQKIEFTNCRIIFLIKKRD